MRHERLKALADSINETARMARVTLTLLLTAALYLGFTLLSSSDENLLLNAQVAVLQVGFGMALEQSYIFGPPIFLYLHVQVLFLLSILARKVRKYNKALNRDLLGIPNSHPVRQEYWNWLSAFAFVQIFQDDRHNFVPRLLMWISMAAIPLLLLLLVDLSFVRYQSKWITYSHHVAFILDLVFLIIWYKSWGSKDAPDRSGNNLNRTWGWLVLASITALLLISEVRPPSFDTISIEEIVLNENQKDKARKLFEKKMMQRRNRIWSRDDDEPSDNNTIINAVWAALKEDVSVLDIGPCQWWGLACRYLSIRDLWLVSARPVDVLTPKIGESGEGSSEPIPWSSLNELSLVDRNLRFADFRLAKLQGANLEGTDLRGANLELANLQDTNLSGAKMDGANLYGAKLQYASLFGAELRSANLYGAKLQHASLFGAKLWNANLKGAQLQRTNFTEAELQGADMKSAYMDGASLWGATLTCTNLQGARLRGVSFARAYLLGTNLTEAQLQGAKFQSAKLLGTNLAGSQLEGVDFYDAEIRNSFGMPESLKLAWLHKAEIDTDEFPTYFFAESSEDLEKEFESMIPLFWSKEDNFLKDCVKNIPKKPIIDGCPRTPCPEGNGWFLMSPPTL